MLLNFVSCVRGVCVRVFVAFVANKQKKIVLEKSTHPVPHATVLSVWQTAAIELK